jgi:hypothetical protein
MPKSDQEVFDHFHTDYGSNARREIALFAYAKFAQEKYDWVNHEIIQGTPPTEAAVAGWIAALPNSRLAGIYEDANRFFNNAAEAYMRTRMEEERAKAVERSILGQVEAMARRVERATSFKATWLPNLFIGVVASFVFTLVVLGGAAIYRGDPSIFALFKGNTSAHP